jgi:hypothetical protein
MSILTPKIIALDSSTLGNVARDFASPALTTRCKARAFCTALVDNSVFIAITFTHICELLRHANRSVVQQRLDFLSSIPYLAWLRPYRETWEPGSVVDLLRRELHVIVHDSMRDWRDIVHRVPDIWQTGTGAEIFRDRAHVWRLVAKEARREGNREPFTASIARTDPGGIKNCTLGELRQLPMRKREEIATYMRSFAKDLTAQLEQHGDRRLDAKSAANSFAQQTLHRIQAIDALDSDGLSRLLESTQVPSELLTDELTIAELGKLCIYAAQLETISSELRPFVRLNAATVPLNALPSYVLSRRLVSSQHRAERVSGSDFGDSSLAPLVLYADAIDVDKRTFEYLRQIKKTPSQISDLMQKFFRLSDYSEALNHL